MRRFTTLLFALALVAAACGTAEPSTSDDPTPASAVLAGDATTTTPADEHPEDDHSEDTVHEEEEDHDEGAAHEEGDDHEVEGEVDRTVEVTMSEFAFEPAEIHVTAGETVRFLVSNVGAVEHEFRMTTEHAAEEHIAAGHEGHDDEGAEEGHEEILLLVAVGETGTIDVTFHEAGEYDLVACLIPGHFEAGMKGVVEYEA